MKKYGLNLRIPAVKTVGYPKNASYLGWLGEKKVSRYGYSGPPGQFEQVTAAADGLTGFLIPGDKIGVFSGEARSFGGKKVPPGGCNASTERLLNANGVSADGGRPLPFSERRLYVLADDAAAAAYEDPRLVRAHSLWSGCMQRKGFSYGNPGEAERDRRWREGGREAAALERKVASADEGCRLETNYSGIRLSIYAEHQTKVIKSNVAALESIRTLMRLRYTNALRTLKAQENR